MAQGISRRLGCWALLALILAGATAGAQQGQSEPSHVERFADPKAKHERAEKEATARLAANANDTRALLERGVARLNLGKLEQGVNDLGHAAALDPASADARAQLAYGFWLLGRLPDALVAAQAAVALDANHASAHHYVGRLLLETNGDSSQAIEHLRRAVELNPAQIEFRFDLLNAYRRASDLMQAGVQLRLLRTALPPSDPRVAYAEGLLAADLGHLPRAIEQFRRALQANPRFIAARYDLARALVQTERWSEALELAEPLAKEFPQSYTAAYLHALSLQNSERSAEAEKEARRAIGLQPQSADAHTLLGITLAAQGGYVEAGSALETAARLEPKNFDALFYLGRTRYALKDLAGARDAFRAATEVRPDDVEARFFLATALEGLGESEAALAQYHELTRRHPQDAHGHVGLGDWQAKHGQLDEAIVSLWRARELDSKNFEATLALGRVLARQGLVEPAIALLREAAELAPESAEAHYQLALALQRAGRTEEARREFAVVERLNQQYRTRGGGMQPPASIPRRD